ncbi:alpha/beta fold hydrolase [Streptomyces mirabilis]|uniref:alpha/beta fold hydrolase n=1 Tax=Streptomyces mirabilis TaxID=68239 RepID=UPI00167D9F2F
MPLLVCLPGGGYNASYFDVPGYSLVDAARREGFPVVSLDRPGYGGSTRWGARFRSAGMLRCSRGPSPNSGTGTSRTPPGSSSSDTR